VLPIDDWRVKSAESSLSVQYQQEQPFFATRALGTPRSACSSDRRYLGKKRGSGPVQVEEGGEEEGAEAGGLSVEGVVGCRSRS